MKTEPTPFRVISTLVLPFAGVLIAYCLNFLVLFPIIVGDPCAYHNEHIETGPLFNLFYEIHGGTGYHPEPSDLNLVITTIMGLIVGVLLAYFLLWRSVLRKEKNVKI